MLVPSILSQVMCAVCQAAANLFFVVTTYLPTSVFTPERDRLIVKSKSVARVSRPLVVCSDTYEPTQERDHTNVRSAAIDSLRRVTSGVISGPIKASLGCHVHFWSAKA
eukprot:c12538_g1_i2.p2 GENE.c12538_g1_i2~~c12538_g1_i2.p2  ORF type:complete len:109 (+),score=6.76 c12538_g1_i2:472-798(+)